MTAAQRKFDEFVRGFADLTVSAEEHDNVITLLRGERWYLTEEQVDVLIAALQESRVKAGLTPWWW